jgi:hypothetical protein
MSVLLGSKPGRDLLALDEYTYPEVVLHDGAVGTCGENGSPRRGGPSAYAGGNTV